MFETIIAKQTDTDKQCQSFIELYQKYLAGIEWNNAQRESGVQIPGPTMQRFSALEARIDAEWAKIPEPQRSALTEALVIKKLLPDQVRDIVRVFNAKVTKLT